MYVRFPKSCKIHLQSEVRFLVFERNLRFVLDIEEIQTHNGFLPLLRNLCPLFGRFIVLLCYFFSFLTPKSFYLTLKDAKIRLENLGPISTGRHFLRMRSVTTGRMFESEIRMSHNNSF